MGSCHSSRLERPSVALFIPDISYLDDLLEALKLNHNDAAELFKIFGEIASPDKFVTAAKVLNYFGVESSEFFVKVLINYYCKSLAGLGFKEFVVFIWSLCSLQNDYLGECRNI